MIGGADLLAISGATSVDSSTGRSVSTCSGSSVCCSRLRAGSCGVAFAEPSDRYDAKAGRSIDDAGFAVTYHSGRWSLPAGIGPALDNVDTVTCSGSQACFAVTQGNVASANYS